MSVIEGLQGVGNIPQVIYRGAVIKLLSSSSQGGDNSGSARVN
jgi:hypothetical protein